MLRPPILIGVLLACVCTYFVRAQDFKLACVKAHNRFRKMHGVPALKWDSTLQAYALEWAQHMAKTGEFAHRTNPKYGENLYFSSGAPSVTGYKATKAWYDEIKDYNWNKPGFSMATGHFTQVIWRNSKKMGCAYVKNGTNIYVAANYDPPGNYAGKFPANVPKKKK